MSMVHLVELLVPSVLDFRWPSQWVIQDESITCTLTYLNAVIPTGAKHYLHHASMFNL